jgi:hypothetical protein
MSQQDTVGPEALRATVRTVETTERELEVVVRMSNSANRALHYIADIRAIRYDAATGTLTLALSDEGRQVIPATAGNLPNFRYVDPAGEAEILLKVPKRITRFSRTAPPGQLAFEKHELSEVRTVVVEIAWSDVPFYNDTRATAAQRDDMRLPAARWEQHKARSAFEVRPGGQQLR